jgi:cardiolipin synthase
MRTESRRLFRNGLIRLLLVLAAIAVQCWWFVVLADMVRRYAPWVSVLYTYIPFLIILYIYGRETNSAFKMPWMILIAAVPLFGVVMYLILGHHNGTPGMRRKFLAVEEQYNGYLRQDQTVMRALEKRHMKLYRQAYYLLYRSGYPVYKDTAIRFYDDAARAYEAQLEAVRNAKRFIFIEYYAIEERGSFERLERLLKEKTREGVEIRMIYDDLGSNFSLYPRHFDREMKAMGVQCRRFNPMMPVLDVFMGNRDHRKIMVVDGRIGFTGGYNLANEYFHRTSPYGWWKDSGVRLTGSAVRTLTVLFLEMWNSISETDHDIDRYVDLDPQETPEDGTLRTEALVQPYADTPLDTKRTGEEVYMNLIRAAERYIYISTPYLILTDEMTRELTSAAERGVDVRIAIPGTPDKRIVYAVTRAYCDDLVMKGVRVYEYLPGFNHAKQFACDDEMCTVGTVNMDFRSFYHHFEDGVLIFDRETTVRVRDDLAGMFAAGRMIDRESVERYRRITQIGHTLLRLGAPMM